MTAEEWLNEGMNYLMATIWAKTVSIKTMYKGIIIGRTGVNNILKWLMNAFLISRERHHSEKGTNSRLTTGGGYGPPLN